MYQDYKERKAKGLITLNERRVTRTVEIEGEAQNETNVSFYLDIKQFSEKDGSEVGSYREELNLEALKKERVLQQGRLEDLDELIADIEAKINDPA